MIDLAEIASTIESTPTVLRSLLAPFDDDALNARPEPGEWCVREVIGHLIATDTAAFADRIAAILAGDPDIGSFDPWAAINARDFTDGPLDDLLAEFEAVRTRSVQFVRSLSDSDLTATARYGANGDFAAADFVHEWPYHDQEHLRQILANLQGRYMPHLTDTMRRALIGE
ncbi:MAG: DinB family protein [Ilumatobacteraceae bacterium]